MLRRSSSRRRNTGCSNCKWCMHIEDLQRNSQIAVNLYGWIRFPFYFLLYQYYEPIVLLFYKYLFIIVWAILYIAFYSTHYSLLFKFLSTQAICKKIKWESVIGIPINRGQRLDAIILLPPSPKIHHHLTWHEF